MAAPVPEMLEGVLHHVNETVVQYMGHSQMLK
jgi:hypothetical protein